MIKCKNTDCTYGYCCIECDAQKSKGITCDCNIAEDLEHDRTEILNNCQFATQVN